MEPQGYYVRTKDIPSPQTFEFVEEFLEADVKEQNVEGEVDFLVKGSLTKPLSLVKVHWLDSYFFGPVLLDFTDFLIVHPCKFYSSTHECVFSLLRQTWVWEHVVDAYMMLL